MGRRRSRRASVLGRAARAAVALTLVTGAVAGCATQAGGVPGELERAVRAGGSAASSGALAVEALRDDRITLTVADIALVDALRETQDAEVAVATLDVRTSAEHALRTDAWHAVHAATTAIVDARAWVAVAGTTADAPGGAQAQRRLAASASDLQASASRLAAAP